MQTSADTFSPVSVLILVPCNLLARKLKMQRMILEFVSILISLCTITWGWIILKELEKSGATFRTRRGFIQVFEKCL